jgi:hypothetical protein
MATRHRRAINCSDSSWVLQKLYIRLISPQHGFVQKGRTAEFSATFWYRISSKSFGLYSNDGKYVELFEQQTWNESVKIIETKQAPSYDINVQIYLFDTRYNTSGLIRVLVSRSHSNCSLGYMPTVARPIHTRHCICTGVQPTLLYLYRCSTYISLSVQVFNLHFSICTGVQPTLLYLYRCSTYISLPVHVFNHTSLSAHVFNLHFSIYTGVQPTLLYL